MWQRNNGKEDAASLQNQFTAYLVTAVRRKKEEYMKQRNKQLQLEFIVEEMAWYLEFSVEPDLMSELPLLMQLECDPLAYALKEIKEKERYVFLAHVLDEKSFEELAAELHLGYKGVAAVYYRAIQKIKNKMKGEK